MFEIIEEIMTLVKYLQIKSIIEKYLQFQILTWSLSAEFLFTFFPV
jgi:hypothetical protein